MGLLESETTPYLGMVLSTTAQVGLIIISKRAMATEMTNYTFVAYSNALAALILLPLALIVHRSPSRPSLTFLLVCGFFLLGVLGCLAQLFGYTGINYTSAAFASAMLNLIPGFTFILAVIFRMEKLACRSSSFMAKAIGTVVSIAGAFIVTLYKGPLIITLQSTMKLHYENILISEQSNWIIGGLFLALDGAVASGYIIVQAFILKSYPAELIIVFFYCFFAAILSTVLSLIVDRELSAWTLQPSIRLLAVLSFFGSVWFCIPSECKCLVSAQKGSSFCCYVSPPEHCTAFGLIFLGDTLYLGSLVGSIIIVIGFYSVMWGKAKEAKVTKSSVTNENAPLLTTEDDQMKI